MRFAVCVCVGVCVCVCVCRSSSPLSPSRSCMNPSAAPATVRQQVRISDCAQSNLHTNLKSGPPLATGAVAGEAGSGVRGWWRDVSSVLRVPSMSAAIIGQTRHALPAFPTHLLILK